MSQKIQKTICVIGGSGFVGMNIAKQASALGIHTYCISRTGKSPVNWNDKNVEFVQGNAINPQTFEQYLQKCDAVIHTVGTLVDKTYTSRGVQPGDPGTYEYMNRDTAINCGKQIEQINRDKQKNIKIVYVSASKQPPFLPRYLSTKFEAEQFLLNLENTKATILRPGFVYSSRDRGWSIPLKYAVDLYSGVFNLAKPLVGKIQFINQNFDVDSSVSADALAQSAIVSAFDHSFDSRILFNQDMFQIQNNFVKYIQNIKQQ